MTEKIFEINIFEFIEWVEKNSLFMTYLYALERNNWKM